MERDRRQPRGSAELFRRHLPAGAPTDHLPQSWRRWATADRDPIAQRTFGRATLLGDAAHPTLQYLAQGACMAIEDAVTLGEALRVHDNDFDQAFALYQRSRVARTARIVLSAREMGRIFHARGWSAWCATTCGRAAHPSGFTTRWSGCTAGMPATAWPPDSH